MSLSTLGKIGMADKLSVAQLQQAVKAGSIPSYIGVPLIAEKMKEEQEAEAARIAQQPAPPKVAEQIMAAAAQQEMSGLGDLPTNLPEQYAAGGIIGYDEGGDVTQEEYDEALEDAEFAKYAQAMINRTPNVEKGLRSAPSISYSQVQGQAPRNAAAPGDGINSLIEKYAAKHGVPVDLARNIAMAESGGSFNSKDPRSSARGPFGMIESTWKSLGGTAENRNDPEANVDLGIKLIKQNAESMKGSLGKNPSYGDIYAAHHFGTGVSKMLAKADPNESIESGLSRFESPSRIKAIMSSNPHLRGKTVGEVESMLNKKGGEGVYAMAEGGIARFAEGGSPFSRWLDETYPSVQPVDPEEYVARENKRAELGSKSGILGFFQTQTPEEYKQANIDREAANKSLLPQKKTITSPAPESGGQLPGRTIGPDSTQPAPTKEQLGKGTPGSNRALAVSADKDLPIVPFAEGDKNKTDKNGTSTGEPTTPEKPSPWQELRDMVADSKKRREEQKQQDMWLAIMSGGLGALAGQSQYANVNIGQGALHGMQQYGTARREAGKEEAADLKTLANIARYEGMDKYYSDQLENKLAATKGAQDQKEYIAANNVMKNLWEARMDEAKYMYGDPKMWDDETRKKAMAFVNQVKADPKYIDAERRIGQLQGFSVVGQRPAA